DPLRQANRLPIKVLKMLTARTGHILHPEYLQPLPSTPVSPIELDAKKSPLALLAQTCSQIGKPDPSPSSKLSSVTSNGSGGDKDSKSGPLKLSDIGVEDKSSFKPYSKPGSEKKEPGGAGAPAAGVVAAGGEKSGFRVPSATCHLGCSKPAGSSPLAGASPPSVMTASLCRDPYCLSYHCASHLAGATGASCAHDQALKSGYPLVYPTHPLHGVHSSLTGATPPSLAGHPLYPYGFMLPNDPQPHICNWVSASGPCDKRFATSEELLSHLRTHTAFPGTDKLLSGYPSSSSPARA
ncbi:Zinc finger protein 503, partial [Cuculus canorus]